MKRIGSEVLEWLDDEGFFNVSKEANLYFIYVFSMPLNFCHAQDLYYSCRSRSGNHAPEPQDPSNTPQLRSIDGPANTPLGKIARLHKRRTNSRQSGNISN